MASIPKQENITVVDNQCDRCNYIFATRGAYTKHKKANNCKKTDHQCPNCNLYFSSNYVMERHIQQNDCRLANINYVKALKKENATASHNNTSTNIGNMSNNGNGINLNNGNINAQTVNNTSYNISTIIDSNVLEKYLKPNREFEAINDNDINIRNYPTYFNILLTRGISNLPRQIAKILFDKYVKNIALYDRNILSIDESKQKPNQIHIYGKNNANNVCWHSDNLNIEFDEKCIDIIFDKCQIIGGTLISNLTNIGTNNEDYLNIHDFSIDDPKINEIVRMKINSIKYNKKYTIMMDGQPVDQDKEISKRASLYGDITRSIKNNWQDLKSSVIEIIKAKMHITLADLEKLNTDDN